MRRSPVEAFLLVIRTATERQEVDQYVALLMLDGEERSRFFNELALASEDVQSEICMAAPTIFQDME